MEKKNKIRFALLVVLLVATTGLIFFTQSKSVDLVDPTLFKIEGLDKIDHVVLESKEGTIDLKFSGGRWKVNDQFNADKQLIDVLFATIDQAKPKREVGKLNADSVNRWLSRSGVAISWYEADVLKKKFVAGGNIRKTEAYFQLPEGKSYLMTIPGYRVYVSGIFEVGAGMWRDKRIFDFNWRNFKNLSVQFPSEPKENFTVNFKGQYFGIDDVAKVDTTRLNDYLDAISLLNAREYLPATRLTDYDSILKVNPSFTVEVKDIADRSYRLEVFSPQPGKSTTIGRVQQNEIALFDLNTLALIAKRKSYFIQK